jgi:hypothetical protein
MTKHGHRSIRLILLLVLVTGLLPRWVRADDRSQQKPFRPYATSAFGPIGMVYSSGALVINNRRAQGQQMIWDGDLLETLAGTNANVLLNLIGQVTLANSATVRLATKPAELDGDNRDPMLVAALVKGDMAVRLEPKAGAYIEAGGSAYTASRGANFRIEVREGKAVIHEASGTLRIAPQPNRAAIKIFGVLPKQANPSATNGQFKTHTNNETKVQHRVVKIRGLSTTRLVSYTPGATPIPVEKTQTAQVTENLAHRFVRFTEIKLQPSGGGIGEIIDENGRVIVDKNGQVIDGAMTDAEGIVTVIFRAGDESATGQIVVTVDLTPEEMADTTTITTPGKYTWDVTITKPGFLRRRNKILMAAAAALGIIVCCLIPHGKEPLQQKPPPVIP